MKIILLLFVLFSLKASAQSKQDTVLCRALYSEPRTSFATQPVHVTTMWVVLRDGKPVKFLMKDKKRESRMEIWQYRLSGEPRIPKQ